MLSTLEVRGNRLIMKGMKVALRLMPMREPELYTGSGSLLELGRAMADSGRKKALLVTSAGIVKRGQLDALIHFLDGRGVETVVFDGVLPDPTFEVVNQGLDLLHAENCDMVLAVGGGSAIDAAKVIALAAGNDCRPEKLKGFFKARKRALPFYAAPSTAGTGSEVTVAAVISDDVSHRKAFVVDHRTLPRVAALDSDLMLSVPPALTAATGMDALTHAVESYIGTLGDEASDALAEEAIQLIFEHLPRACANGQDVVARDAMALASYKAGHSFTRASLGYVHAISHQLGARYGVPHGLGNAIVLPLVVEFSSIRVQPKLARLAVLLGLG